MAGAQVARIDSVRGTDAPAASLELVGVAEVCALLGLKRMQLKRLRDAGRFPVPVAELAAGPVWRVSDIRRDAEAVANTIREGWAEGLPMVSTRITDEPGADLRRYLIGITGSRPPDERIEAKRRRYEKRGQSVRLMQQKLGGRAKSHGMRGGAYEAAEADLEGQLERGEGYSDPLVLCYAYHVARALMKQENERHESEGSDEIPF